MVKWWKYLGRKEFFEVYCKLIEAAKGKAVIHYENIAQIMNLPSSGNYMAREVGEMLGIISALEHFFGRPMLSAVVVRKDTGEPGDGFFELAESLGKFNPASQARSSFWRQEVQDVYNTWQ